MFPQVNIISQPPSAAAEVSSAAEGGGGGVIELALGCLVAAMLGAREGAIVAAGIPIGVLLYFVSCLYWQAAPCWWPWCTARKQVKKGPGRRRRIRRKCWRCGGSGLVERWGTRVWSRRRDDRD